MFSQLPLYIATGFNSSKRMYIVPCANISFNNRELTDSAQNFMRDDNIDFFHNDLLYTINKVNDNIDRGLIIRGADSGEVIEDFGKNIRYYTHWSRDNYISFEDSEHLFYIGYLCVEFDVSDDTQFNKIISEAIVQTLSIQVIILLQLLGVYAQTIKDNEITLQSAYQAVFDLTFAKSNIDELVDNMNNDHISQIRYDLINSFDISDYVDDMIESGEYNTMLRDFDIIKFINYNDHLYPDKMYSRIESSISNLDYDDVMNHLDVVDLVNNIIFLEEEDY